MLCELSFVEGFHKISTDIFKHKRSKDFYTGQWLFNYDHAFRA